MLRGGLFGARWIDPQDYHVTLRFLGDIDLHSADEFLYELQRIRKPETRIAFEDISAFGGDRPRAIIARVKANKELIEIQAEHERVARKVGLEANTQKYTPHVTIARLRNIKAVAVAEYLSVRGFLLHREFVAKHFAVFSSRESTGGGPYVVEATYPLVSALGEMRVTK